MTRPSLSSALIYITFLITNAACVKPNPDLLVESSSNAVAETGEDTGDDTGEAGEGAGESAPTDMAQESCTDESLALTPECSACLEQACCAEMIDCVGDQDCACMSACLIGGDDQIACALECGTQGTLELPATTALGQCAQTTCGVSCTAGA